MISGLLVAAVAGSAAAQPEADAAIAAEVAPSTPVPSAASNSAEDDEVTALHDAASKISALRAGTLDPRIDPAQLFDVRLDDAAAVRVELERLRLLLEERAPPKQQLPAKPTRRTRRSAPDDVRDAGPTIAGDVTLLPLDSERWAARLELDHARLGFYALPGAERNALLEAHAERAKESAAKQRSAKEAISEAEQRARAAADERKRAAEAAQRARTEAERVVADEHVRLLGVAQRQSEADAQLARQRGQASERTERTLGLRRQVRELRAMQDPNRARADALYDTLRVQLRAVRDLLSTSLTTGVRAVPKPSAEAPTLPEGVDHNEIDQLRATLVRAAGVLQSLLFELRETEVDQLNSDMVALNADRLALLPLLSRDKRNAITGFGASGIDQAAAEIRQVTLLARYHFHVLMRWTASLRTGSSGRGAAAAATGFVAIKWAVAFAIFFSWRRRAQATLLALQTRARAAKPASVAVESSAERVLSFAMHVREPLEWLLLVFVLVELLPGGAQRLFEVDITTIVLVWTLGGALVVLSVDALAGDLRGGQQSQAPLRLRSLRLLGRTVVGFGLILALSDRLVGKGTVHSWVFSTCWFVALPIAVLIVRWWRETIFERVHRIRRKSAFHNWAIANQQGWMSPLSAIAAGATLFVHGGLRSVRAWASRFDLTRRVLAYLFRRGLDKLGDEGSRASLRPLEAATFDALSPDLPSQQLIRDRPFDEADAVVDRIARAGGGVLAIIGERGAGKTTVLQRVGQRPDTVVIQCPLGGLDALRRELATRVGLSEDANLDDAAAIIDAANRDAGLLIDDAHRLIQPVMGGLAAFDRLIEVARRRSSTCTWVLAVDESVWRFFERARGARPLFDEVIALSPWREEHIARLLVSRSASAGITPRFDELIGKLPADADEVDREEALAATAAGYYRLLWDYAAGNPGVALHMWRRSLAGGEGAHAQVKVFRAPDTRDLDHLPDTALFVLRALVQLEPALPTDIASATQLGPAAVQNALRYGVARGYFAEEAGRYTLTWGWFRAITRFLQRRHLLVTGR